MSNIKAIDVKVEGLHPKKSYTYQISNQGGNWPVRVSPLSGVFSSGLTTYVYFCASTGLCPPSDPNVFFNTPSTNISSFGLDIGNHSLYSVIGLSIIDSDSKILSTKSYIVECDECLPSIDIHSPNIVLGPNDGYSKSFTIELDGLLPNQDYAYNFQAVNGNWPIKILPISGSLVSSSNSGTIHGLVTFCSSSGSCLPANSLLPFERIEKCDNGEEKYNVIQLSVSGINTLQSPTRNNFSIVCDGCDRPEIVSSFATVAATTGNPLVDIPFVISNLKRSEKYNIIVRSLSSNWPITILSKSGEFSGDSVGLSYTFNTSINFCDSTGLCPNGAVNVEPYVIDTLSSTRKQATLVAEVFKNCDPDVKIKSSEVQVLCNNCIPSPIVRFADSVQQYTNLSEACCTGIYNLEIIVNNTLFNAEYEYVFNYNDDYTDASFVLLPSNSGRFKGSLGTTTNISVLASGNMQNYDIIPLSVTVKDVARQISDTNYTLIKCGTDLCE